jgi:deoxyribonuclease-4
VRIGAHVRRQRGGVSGIVEACRIRGADCAQVFVSNPRGWAPPRIEDEDAAAFREAWTATGLGPLIAHAPYLVNIASPNPAFLEKSRALPRATAATCDALGIGVLVLHAGAGGTGEHAAALARAGETLRVVAGAAQQVRVSVELMAGTSGAVASTPAEAARLFDEAGGEELGLCLDTCHLFAAGAALDAPEGARTLVTELREQGLDRRLALIHANDSMFERGARRDRHANIGDGFLGEAGFRAILAQPALTAVPLILETPGDAARHAADIATLRTWAPAYGSSSARGPSW